MKKLDVGMHKLSKAFASIMNNPNKLFVISEKAFVVEN